MADVPIDGSIKYLGSTPDGECFLADLGDLTSESEKAKAIATIVLQNQQLKHERDELVLVLRGFCEQFRLDNGWSDDLHLADVVRNIEKELLRDSNE